MEEIILEAELRKELGKGKVKDLRRRGFIPAVVYAEGKESQGLKISHSALLKLLHAGHKAESMVINLKLKDADKKQKERSVLIKEIQYDPVSSDIIHVDFNQISLTKVIKVAVPIEAEGEPIGVKQEGGSLDRILWEVEVECLPTQIPEKIKVDVSDLKIGDSVQIKDIKFPEGLKVLPEPDTIVLSVSAPIKEEIPVEAEVGEEAPQEPEVIMEKKEAAEEEAGREKEEAPKEKAKEKEKQEKK